MSIRGQEPPVEVDSSFDQPRSRLPSLNGRFPASELLAALPQRGQLLPLASARLQTLKWPILSRQRTSTRHPYRRAIGHFRLCSLRHPQCAIDNPASIATPFAASIPTSSATTSIPLIVVRAVSSTPKLASPTSTIALIWSLPASAPNQNLAALDRALYSSIVILT